MMMDETKVTTMDEERTLLLLQRLEEQQQTRTFDDDSGTQIRENPLLIMRWPEPWTVTTVFYTNNFNLDFINIKESIPCIDPHQVESLWFEQERKRTARDNRYMRNIESVHNPQKTIDFEFLYINNDY